MPLPLPDRPGDRAHPWPQALRLRGRQWVQDHLAVADLMAPSQWARLRWALPLGALLHLLALPWAPTPWAQAAVALALAGLAAWQHAWRRHTHTAVRQWWPCLAAALVLVLHAALVTWNPQAPLRLAPWWLATLAVAAVGWWRPAVAAALLGGGALCLTALAGLGQHDPATLTPQRLQVWLAAAVAWALSVWLWRLQTLVALRERQLREASQTLEQHQRDLERLTRRDGLTGLFNRHTFTKLTEKELARARRLGTATSVLLIDLDFFKRVNDTHGHPAGDAVLKHVARVLSESVRTTDLVGRLGGEEFIVLLPATVSGAARILADKLRTRVQAQVPQWEGTPIPTTISIGLSAAAPTAGLTFETLYAKADAALYEAKKGGRNRVCVSP